MLLASNIFKILNESKLYLNVDNYSFYILLFQFINYIQY